MRATIGLLGLVLTMAIAIGSYYYFFKQSVSGSGTNAVQQISLTGVQGDLLQIAQAERMYWAQNGSYVDLDKLTSSGSLTMTRSGRDGYTYTVNATDSGFTATATYAAPIPPTPTGALPQHYPTMTIDQTMEIHQSD
jgi:Tfp pilus assembly protein PilE